MQRPVVATSTCWSRTCIGNRLLILPWWLHWGRLRLSGSQIVEEDRRGSVLAPLRSRQLQAVIKEATECVLSIAGFWRHGPVPHEAQL